MLPDIVENTNFNYLKVNNKYIQSIYIKELPENIFFLDFVKDLPYNLDFDMSIFINKLDSVKILNDITFSIGTAQSELNTINSNQRNIDVISKAKEDASELRKKLQIENQEIYDVSIILTFYSNDLNQLFKNILSIKSKFYSKGISSEITNFRHLQFYLFNLPICIKNNKYLNNIYLTTNALSNIFPFYLTNFVDNGGIIIGYTERKRLCMLNIFNLKYENSNMCIFGCSGSGKSYFMKVFIIRNFFLERKQIILDIEGEYENVCNGLDGQIMFKSKYYNILEIRKKDLIEEDYLESKINKVLNFISNFCNINRDYLKDRIYKLYNKFNITKDVNSIFTIDNTKIVSLENKIISKEKFPTLIDLVEDIDNQEQKNILSHAIQNELKFFSKKTDINENNMLFVLNIKNIFNKPKLISIIIKEILENYLGEYEIIIYIDEVWKYIQNDELVNDVFNLYKTIRKKKASIITATQDVEDLFEYKNGLYANSILNNSCFKLFFKFNQIFLNTKIKDINYDELLGLKKGEVIVNVDKSNLKLKIKANQFEREIINENDFIT